MLRLTKLIKNLLLFIPISLIFYPLSRFFAFTYYLNSMVLWILKTKGEFANSDYFSPIRDYDKRYKHYEFILNNQDLSNKQFNYLEFGVAKGNSYKWWLEHNKNKDSRFWGFDTFAGLPEDWGTFYSKGDMSFAIPDFKDERAKFIKGLFQDTLVGLVDQEKATISSKTLKIIHLDADLYSATIFALSILYPYLNNGDIIMFDEFNVPMHEYKAYREFVDNFYIKLKPLSAVNNFYQTAFIIEK